VYYEHFDENKATYSRTFSSLLEVGRGAGCRGIYAKEYEEYC